MKLLVVRDGRKRGGDAKRPSALTRAPLRASAAI